MLLRTFVAVVSFVSVSVWRVDASDVSSQPAMSNDTLDSYANTTATDYVDSNRSAPETNVLTDDTDGVTSARAVTYPGNALTAYFVRLCESFLERVIQPMYLTDVPGVDLADYDDVERTLTSDRAVWVRYFAGYVITAVLVTAIVVVVTATAVTVSCCRCRGRCGGNVGPVEGKRARCARTCYGGALFAVTCLAGVAVYCLFTYNEQFGRQFRHAGGYMDEIARDFNDVDAFLDGAVRELDDDVTRSFATYLSTILARVRATPGRIARTLMSDSDLKNFRTTVDQLGASLSTKLLPKLNIAHSASAKLQTLATSVHAQLLGVRESLLDALPNVTDDTRMRVELLSTGSNFSDTDITPELTAVRIALDTIDNVTDAASAAIISSRREWELAMRQPIAEVTRAGDDVGAKLDQLLAGIRGYARGLHLANISEAVRDSKALVASYGGAVYWTLMAVTVVVTLILCCKLIGLFYAVACRRSATYEVQHACETRRTTGAAWLVAGVGVTVIFAGVVMAVATTLFVVAGVTRTEVCRHVLRPNDVRSAHVIRVIDRLASRLLRNDVNILRLYTRCETNASFYDAADLPHRGYSVSRAADVEALTDAARRMKNIHVSIPEVTLLSPEMERSMGSLGSRVAELDVERARRRSEANVSAVDVGEMWRELNETWRALNETWQELNETWRELSEMTNETGSDISGELTTLRRIIDRDIPLIDDAKLEFQRALDDVILPLEEAKQSLTRVITAYTQAQTVFNRDGASIASGIINRTVDLTLLEARQSRDRLVRRVVGETARCRPVYAALARVVNATCDGLVAPLNGYWFVLAGVMLLLLLPCAAPLSLALATQLRRTERRRAPAAFCYEHAYDAYRIADYGGSTLDLPRDRLVEKTAGRERMGSVDNPVYLMESDVPPRLPMAEQPCPPGFPLYSVPTTAKNSRPSPPPSYQSSKAEEGDGDDDDDRSTYDTRL